MSEIRVQGRRELATKPSLQNTCNRRIIRPWGHANFAAKSRAWGTGCEEVRVGSGWHGAWQEGRYEATWKRGFRLPWREAGPSDHVDDQVDSDQKVFNKEVSRMCPAGDASRNQQRACSVPCSPHRVPLRHRYPTSILSPTSMIECVRK